MLSIYIKQVLNDDDDDDDDDDENEKDENGDYDFCSGDDVVVAQFDVNNVHTRHRKSAVSPDVDSKRPRPAVDDTPDDSSEPIVVD